MTAQQPPVPTGSGAPAGAAAGTSADTAPAPAVPPRPPMGRGPMGHGPMGGLGVPTARAMTFGPSLRRLLG